MADTIYNNKLDLPVSIRRTNNVPLDDASVFEDIEAVSSYITPPGGASNSTAYAGQIIYVKEHNVYYSIVSRDNNSLGLELIPNTQDIRTIDQSQDAGTTNIKAVVKFDVSDDATPGEKEIVFDSNTNELKIGLSSGTQVLSPSWNGSDATFRGDVKAKTFTIEDTTGNNEITLDEEDFKLINSLTAYTISEFTVNVFDTTDTKIEDLKFNFRDGISWADWSLANTSSGFRCVDIDNYSYIRYKNSYLVYTDSTNTVEVEPSDEISKDTIYYCKPADTTGPITNITFDKATGKLSWTNPTVGGLNQAIGGIRILYRTDRYPEHESDLMYVFNSDGNYVQADSKNTGYIYLNSTEVLKSEANNSINLTSTMGENLQNDTLYYFYIAPCTNASFYTESKHQRCLVYIEKPNQAMTASLDDPEANTSNSPLETLLGV